MPDIKEKKIINKLCLISFSNNADHQNVVYSMYKALKNQTEVYTIGIMKAPLLMITISVVIAQSDLA